MKEDMISVHSLAEKQKEFLKVYDILCTTLSVEVQDLTALTDIDTFTVYRMLRKLEKIGIIKKREEDGKKPTYEYYRQANAFKYLTKI
jgi:predicted transcriptional regulator